ncbi:MAG: hypothetical protein CM1200mP18_14030 [Gammaproteobacteria bacterium]|nr:MAG: hypothetical protein CM1200mP18_14030 [Gammaproteobacteria bacterium]
MAQRSPDCFTADGVYHDVFYGNFTGRDIARMIEDYFHRDGENFRWDIFEPVEKAEYGLCTLRIQLRFPTA